MLRKIVNSVIKDASNFAHLICKMSEIFGFCNNNIKIHFLLKIEYLLIQKSNASSHIRILPFLTHCG